MPSAREIAKPNASDFLLPKPNSFYHFDFYGGMGWGEGHIPWEIALEVAVRLYPGRLVDKRQELLGTGIQIDPPPPVDTPRDFEQKMSENGTFLTNT